MIAQSFKGPAIFQIAVGLVMMSLSVSSGCPTSSLLVRQGRAAEQRYPHGHPPDDKMAREPRPPEPRGGGWVIPTAVGAGAGVALLGLWLHSRENGEKTLDRGGPQVEQHFNMSGFTVKGFCKGGWPVVLDFQIANGGALFLTIDNNKTSRVYRFEPNRNRRIEEKLILPAEFGENLTAGVYTIRAESSGTGQVHPVYLRMYALGAGERAVGSAAIDLLRFGPDTVPRKGEAQFGFHAHSEFNSGQAEFFRLGLVNNQIVNNLDDKQAVSHRIAEGVQIDETWKTNKAKPGEHVMLVRAWRSKSNGGDFVLAWSPDHVNVQ